jgi:hypothetical protein
VAVPSAWPSPTTLFAGYFFEARPVITGPFIVAPSDIDGTKLLRLSYSPTNTPTAANVFDELTLSSADEQSAFISGDRIYVMHGRSSVFILRAR